MSKRDQTALNADIWVFDLSTGAGTRITSDPAAERGPVWSPDGNQIAYTANPGGSFGLYRPWQTSGQGALCTCAWRQDGKELQYVAPGGSDGSGSYDHALKGIVERRASKRLEGECSNRRQHF